MKVSEIGEFKLIEAISRLVTETNVPAHPDRKLITGIGDDCAAWKCRGKVQLSTTDCLIQDVHFSFDYAGWQDLGYKAIAVNLSDIAGMGGIPQYAFVSLALPPATEVEDISTLYKGMIEASNKYSTLIAGGNISAADKVFINITLHGYSKSGSFMARSAAQKGDLIALTGYTGLSAAGLQVLKSKLPLQKEAYELLKKAHLRPEPRLLEGQLLLKRGVRTGIDISDGLLADLGHICKASGVSATVRQDDIPIEPALKASFPGDYMSLALSGGEDYELLFTAGPSLMRKVLADFPCPVTVIGEIVEKRSEAVSVVDTNGRDLAYRHPGWNHFDRNTG